MDSKKPKKRIIRLKVVDFTVWNGFKFGVGLTLGSIAVSIVLGIVMFFLTMFFAIGFPPNPLY